MPDHCNDRNPLNRAMTCTRPTDHDGDHRFGDTAGAGSWPRRTEAELEGLLNGGGEGE